MNPENLQSSESLEDKTNAWVAQFAPLVLDENTAFVEVEIQKRLKTINELMESAGVINHQIAKSEHPIDSTLATTFDQAFRQLASIEAETRRQLGKIAPGNPDGIADLDKLNEKLAERAARDELGITNDDPTAPLRSFVSGPNIAAAGFMGIFGFGWTCFTAVHATLMIGGMMSAFGWGALLLLGFYMIFFAVGFAMLAGAINFASTESIEVDGNTLTVFRKFGPWLRKKSYEIDTEIEARIDSPPVGFVGTPNSNTKAQAILMTDTQNRTISFGSQAEAVQRKKLCDRINAYLRGVRL